MSRSLPALLALGLLAGCGVQATPTSTATVRSAGANQAVMFDRFEAVVASEPGSELAVLSITAKGLLTKFTDDDVTVFVAVRSGDEPQQNLFSSKVYLADDGRLYLQERRAGHARSRFYQVGAYQVSREPGRPVQFHFGAGMKLEARNRSIMPIGGGPFLALVVNAQPAPVTQAPHLVRGQ
ncbi:MAG: hypothetical protein ACK46X_12890 [Candidatus Sericytochromatia bacterium]